MSVEPIPELVAVCEGGSLELFIDGKCVGKSEASNSWLALRHLTPNSIIAVACRIQSPPGALLASTIYGIISDSTWRCTRDYYDDWFTVTFDDNGWPFANTICPAKKSGFITKFYPRSKITDISEEAYWITTGSYGAIGDLYCRRNTAPKILTGRSS